MRNLVLSGASRGIGRELRPLLTAAGYRVISMGNRTKNPVDISVDLTSLAQTKHEISSFLSDKDQLSVVVCNAGTGRPPIHLDQSQWPKYFQRVNVLTAQNLVSSCIDRLIPRHSMIIGISSIATLTEITNAPKGYAESKMELNRYFESLALELAPLGIRVNLLTLGNVMFPGSRWSEISISNPDLVDELLAKKVPFGEFISPIEIAQAIIYLASDSAKNITGANLVLDGGQSLSRYTC